MPNATANIDLDMSDLSEDQRNDPNIKAAFSKAAAKFGDALNAAVASVTKPKPHWAVTAGKYALGALAVGAVGLFSYRAGKTTGYEIGYEDGQNDMPVTDPVVAANQAISNAQQAARNRPTANAQG